jgi:hypothetical protein
MINDKQVQTLDLICSKYKIKKCCAMTRLIDIEDHIHKNYGSNFSKSYFYLSLGHLNDYYKKAMELW